LVIPTLHIHLLGDFLLVSGDSPVTTVTVPRVQSLLAYLVLHRSTPQNRSHLAFLLWPDSTEAQAHTNLRQLLYHLRQSLPDADQFLSASKQSLQWLPANADGTFTLDIQEMEQALAQAEQAEQRQDMTTMRQSLEQVLHLYRGDLLPSCYDEWVVPERDRLRQVFLQAAERLIALLEEEREYSAAIQAAQQLLRQDPLHEATYRQLMRLYALRGDRAAALRVYYTCTKLLDRELGTEPSEVTRAVYEALVPPDNSPEKQASPLPKRRTEAPLLGRKAEWRRLQEAWHKAAAGHPHILILTGEAGIGKTRLAEEIDAWVSRQGITTARALLCGSWTTSLCACHHLAAQRCAPRGPFTSRSHLSHRDRAAGARGAGYTSRPASSRFHDGGMATPALLRSTRARCAFRASTAAPLAG
jgi:DNA-binding SARP family transcriptional activator